MGEHYGAQNRRLHWIALASAGSALLLFAISIWLWFANRIWESCFTALGCIAALGVAVTLLGWQKYHSPARFVTILRIAATLLMVCGVALVILAAAGFYALLFLR